MENGIRRTRISDGSVTEYTWDYRNRLTSVTERAGGVGTAATKVVNYQYDVSNRLVGKTLDPDGAGEEEATEEYYAYDQTPFSTRENASQMLFRFTGPSTADLADRYLWAPVVDLLLSDEKLTAPDEPGDVYWALGDNLNTIRDIARYDAQSDTTTIVNHRVFDAFGNITSETNAAVDLLFAFTGRLFDESTGLQNNLHRWYDPAVGRWLSEDPIGFQAGDPNLYRYVNNSSTYASDPTGQYRVIFGSSEQDKRLVTNSLNRIENRCVDLVIEFDQEIIKLKRLLERRALTGIRVKYTNILTDLHLGRRVIMGIWSGIRSKSLPLTFRHQSDPDNANVAKYYARSYWFGLVQSPLIVLNDAAFPDPWDRVSAASLDVDLFDELTHIYGAEHEDDPKHRYHPFYGPFMETHQLRLCYQNHVRTNQRYQTLLFEASENPALLGSEDPLGLLLQALADVPPRPSGPPAPPSGPPRPNPPPAPWR